MNNSSGQVLLMTMLIMTLGITIALAAINKTSIDTRITKDIEESQKALRSAEAGVEQALIDSQSVTNISIDGSGSVVHDTTVESIDPGDSYETSLIETGSEATFWLTEHQNNQLVLNDDDSYNGTTIQICWSKGTPSGAVYAMVYYVTQAGSYRVIRRGFDSLAASRNNGFSATNDILCGLDTEGTTLNLPMLGIAPEDILLMLRLRPLYENLVFTISPQIGFDFPNQGYRITSIGKTPEGITRKIEVFQEFEQPSQIFDSVLISSGSLIH